MTRMTTIKITLQTLSSLLDPFGASVFTEPTVELAIEVPRWITATFGTELDSATLVRTEDDRLVAGIAVNLARAAARALDLKDATEILATIHKLDALADLSCDFWEGDDLDELDNSTVDCIVLTHIPSEISFIIYTDGLADLIYGKEA